MYSLLLWLKRISLGDSRRISAQPNSAKSNVLPKIPSNTAKGLQVGYFLDLTKQDFTDTTHTRRAGAFHVPISETSS